MGFELIEKAGELIADFGSKKIKEYKTKEEWKDLFVDTGEFLVQNFERADKLFDDMAIAMSKTNMIELANSVKDTNGFELKSALMKKLEKLMCEYEIPQDVARSFVIRFFEVVIADIKKSNPEKYQEYYLDEWHEENKEELSIIQGRIEAVYDAVKEVARRAEIYSMDRIELQLLQQTENPCIGLDFFEIDDEVFQKEFENSLRRECIYVKGQCREETVYCLLNELRRLKVAQAVFVIKSQEDWEKFQQTSVNKVELQGKILIPWFNSYEITAIPNNINIFVFGKDDYCVGKEPIEMKKRTRKTIREGLQISGADYQRADDLVSDTHGLFIPLKKKLLKGKNNIVPTWVSGNKKLVLPILLCGKWQDNAGDILILEQLSGKKHDQIVDEIQQLCKGEEPLLVKYQIRSRTYYQLASVENAWDYLDEEINVEGKLWTDFLDLLFEVLNEDNPVFKFPVKEHSLRAIMPENQLFWSDDLRNGMLTSLIMKACYKRNEKSQYSINQVILKLLNAIQGKEQWMALAKYFPIICEVAPNIVLTRLDQEWNTPTGLTELFKDRDDSTLGRNYYTHILWGVEQFLVQKEFCVDAVKWLFKLADMRIKYSLGNSPEDTLKRVFCAWTNLTALSVKEKIILGGQMVKEYNMGWSILYAALPERMTCITGTFSKPKYREIYEADELSNEDIRNLFKSYEEICIENMEFNVERWIKMIEEANNIDLDSEIKLFDKMEYELISMDDAEKILLKETLRKEIHRHRFYKSSIWSLGEDRLKRYEDVMSNIHTDEPEYEYRYLFASEYQFPLLHPVPYNDDSYDESRGLNKRAMEDEVQQKIGDFQKNKYNLARLVQVCEKENSANLGDYIYRFYSNEIFDIKTFEILLDNAKEGKKYCIDYLKCAYLKDENHILDAVELSKKKEIDDEFLVSLFAIEIIDAEVLPLISRESDNLKNIYWSHYYHWHKKDDNTIRYMLDECKEYGTFDKYLKILESAIPILNSCELLEYFIQLERLKVDEKNRIDQYALRCIFKALQSEYIEDEEKCALIAKEEIVFRNIIDWPDMKCLKRMLEKTPDIYAEMASVIYLKDGEDKNDEVDEEKRNIVNNVYHLYSKMIFCPAEKDGMVSEDDLDKWVMRLVRLLKEQRQERLLGQLLGRILAYSPVDSDGYPPCQAVRKVIEDYGDESLINSYATSIFNQRGVYTPTAGKEERRMAENYQHIAEHMKKEGYSKTASIYHQLYKQYMYEASSGRKEAEYGEF